MNDKQEFRDAREFITPQTFNRRVTKKSMQITNQLVLRDLSNTQITDAVKRKSEKKVQLIKQLNNTDGDSGTEMLIKIPANHIQPQLDKQKKWKENIELAQIKRQQPKHYRVKLQPIRLKDPSFDKPKQSIDKTNNTITTTSKSSKFSEQWSKHIFQFNNSCGNSEHQYQLFVDTTMQLLCSATKKWKLFGDEFNLNCKIGTKSVSGVLYKNMVGSRFTLFIQEKLSAVIDYDCRCTTGTSKRLRGLQMRIFNNDQLNDKQLRLIPQQSIWNPIKNAYTLNFNGRVKMGSINNFILKEDTQNKDSSIVLFGKISKNTYALDIKQPLSLLQAFALGISSVTYKLGTM